MADTGWISPGTMASDSAAGGTRPWANPDNAKLSNNAYATAAGTPSGGSSYYLKATNFGFAIPAGATIDGIKVQFERKRGATANVSDWKIHIVKASGAYGTQNKSGGWNWTTSEGYIEFGGDADLWGEVWGATDINDPDFGVGLAVGLDPLTVAYVDHVRIKVYYTEVALTNMKVNIGDVFKDVDEIKINIGGAWKAVTKVQINIGDVWKTMFG